MRWLIYFVLAALSVQLFASSPNVLLIMVDDMNADTVGAVIAGKAVVTSFETQYIFGFFAFMMTLQLIWVLTMVPETKGKTLEEIEQALNIR